MSCYDNEETNRYGNGYGKDMGQDSLSKKKMKGHLCESTAPDCIKGLAAHSQGIGQGVLRYFDFGVFDL